MDIIGENRGGIRIFNGLESDGMELRNSIHTVPVDRITVMTTGRKGVYQTPYGVLDFTHTDRSYAQILDGTVDIGRPFRFAKMETAWRDLKRVGRNTFLVNFGGLEDDQEF